MTVDDVLAQLSEESAAEFDRQGYALLAEHGYKVEGAGRDPAVLRAVKRRMRRRRESLIYDCSMTDEGFLLWVELRRRGRLLGRSRGLHIKLGRAQ